MNLIFSQIQHISTFIWKKFEEAILQIDIGNYIIKSDEYQLGILQSNRFYLLKYPN